MTNEIIDATLNFNAVIKELQQSIIYASTLCCGCDETCGSSDACGEYFLDYDPFLCDETQPCCEILEDPDIIQHQKSLKNLFKQYIDYLFVTLKLDPNDRVIELD